MKWEDKPTAQWPNKLQRIYRSFYIVSLIIWLESHQLPKTEHNEPQNASLESLFEEMFSKEFCELLPNWSKSLLWALCLKPRWTHWWPVPGATGGHIGLSSKKKCSTMMMWNYDDVKMTRSKSRICKENLQMEGCKSILPLRVRCGKKRKQIQSITISLFTCHHYSSLISAAEHAMPNLAKARLSNELQLWASQSHSIKPGLTVWQVFWTVFYKRMQKKHSFR